MTRANPAPQLPEHGQLAEINPACDTGQRWWHGQHTWVRRSRGGFDSNRYEVTPISDPAAKSYVERMHYSGSYVAASRRYGMFLHTDDGPDLVGVAVFAIPAQAPYTESLELARFVLEGQPLLPAGSPAPRVQRAPGKLRDLVPGRMPAPPGTRRDRRSGQLCHRPCAGPAGRDGRVHTRRHLPHP
jgi:hypothetical protein